MSWCIIFAHVVMYAQPSDQEQTLACFRDHFILIVTASKFHLKSKLSICVWFWLVAQLWPILETIHGFLLTWHHQTKLGGVQFMDVSLYKLLLFEIKMKS